MNNKKFLDSIFELTTKEPNAGRERLQNLILDYGSHTPDNIEAIQNITCLVKETTSGIGTNSGILASDIINTLEESHIPAAIKLRYPELEQKEWEGVLRFCTLILCACEQE